MPPSANPLIELCLGLILKQIQIRSKISKPGVWGASVVCRARALTHFLIFQLIYFLIDEVNTFFVMARFKLNVASIFLFVFVFVAVD